MSNPVKTKLLERLASHMTRAADHAEAGRKAEFLAELRVARGVCLELDKILGNDSAASPTIKWIDGHLGGDVQG